MPLLRVVSGPHSGQQFPLSNGSVELGRDETCGVSLQADASVSRRHARVDMRDGLVTAHDLGSSFGLFVNGSRTISTIIGPGDQVQLGNSVLVLEPDSPAAVSPSAAPHHSTQLSSGSPAPGQPPGYPAAVSPAMSPVPAAYGGSPYPGAAYGAPAYGAQPYGAPPVASAIPYAKWLYFLGFSIPPVGLLVGLIYLLKETPDERRVGKWCIGWSIVGAVVAWFSWVALMAALHTLQHQSGSNGLQGLLGGGSGADPSEVLKTPAPPGDTLSLPGIPGR